MTFGGERRSSRRATRSSSRAGSVRRRSERKSRWGWSRQKVVSLPRGSVGGDFARMGAPVARLVRVVAETASGGAASAAVCRCEECGLSVGERGAGPSGGRVSGLARPWRVADFGAERDDPFGKDQRFFFVNRIRLFRVWVRTAPRSFQVTWLKYSSCNRLQRPRHLRATATLPPFLAFRT